MIQFAQSMESVVAILRQHEFTTLTVCAQKKWYSELRTHLTDGGFYYSFEKTLD